MEKKQSKQAHTERLSNVGEMLAHLRHYLPSQGPIKDFIHHNTLHMFQEQGMTFHEAIRSASELYGAVEYLPLSTYRAMYAEGKISEAALTQVLLNAGDAAGLLREQMLTGKYPDILRRDGFRSAGYLKSICDAAQIKPEERIHPTVFRLVANYLDQGIAEISIAVHAKDFWSALRIQIKTARPFGLSRRACSWILRHEPEDLTEYLLAKLLPPTADAQTFLLELLMAARGWSGLISQIEENPSYLNYPRRITLAQYVALYLAILTDLALQSYRPAELKATNAHTEYLQKPIPAESEAERVARHWHEAMEWSYYLQALGALAVNAPQKRGRSSAAERAEFQAIFCIDDRECSVRRYLEELSAKFETFGTPGFFGIDAVYQGPYDAISIKQCPVPVKPRHRIRGVATRKRRFALSRLEMNLWHRYANGLFFGWFITLFFGIVSLIRLVFSVHRPKRSFAMASAFASHEDHTHLHYERADGEQAAADGFFEGYTVQEMAERVGRVLRQIGLTHSFAPIVVVVGHGSSSTNNPYFAAYDCGACSGRPGLVNARVFALMANRSDVRLLLAKAGIRIPERTRFVGAIHDTARDELELLDAELIGDEYADEFAKLRQLFTRALELNALERTRRFAIVNFPETERAAVKEVRLRTEMLFEPRPEYNHATNALAVVGRRSLTENLFLDRRAFFNSYDPAADKDGSILNAILTPLIPVCGGINLEYLFSRLDNVTYGAGSKLPHNVFSLVGVGNGSEGDLRTGLPEQMIEIHDPVRLLIVVEQRREIVQRVLAQNDVVRQWIDLEWVHLVVFDLRSKKFYRRMHGDFVALELGALKPPVYADSRAAYYHHRDNITPAILLRKH